ncbi:FAD binding domain-containing protein [Streptomyces sp. NPDC057271]|uniref:FAD binding domain-containing protein n=1 Tax=unclassified Streptomyces TaxID=2593676 RepID=UPI00362DBC32
MLVPAAFDYVAPTSIEEVLTVLSQTPDAKVLAGGQSLLPLMNSRALRPPVVVDVDRVPQLAERNMDGSEFTLGALTRQRWLETERSVAEHIPALGEAAGLIGDLGVRRRGTLGGSLAHADPGAELPVACVLLGAQIEAIGPWGTRSIPASEFFQGPFQTVLDRTELLVSVRVPLLARPSETCAVRELSACRHGSNTVGAARVSWDEDGFCSRLRVVVSGTDGPQDITAEATGLIGTRVTDADLRDVRSRLANRPAEGPDLKDMAVLQAEVTVAALATARERNIRRQKGNPS